EKYGSAKRNVARIDGDGAARRERNAERADGAARRVGERQFTKKHEARVLVEELLETLRIRRRPGLDCRHRSFAELEFTALDEVAPDRLKGMAVLVGVGETPRREIFFQETPRLLVARRAQLHRPRTHSAPRLAPPQCLAGCEESGPGRRLLALLPARQRSEIDGLERVDARSDRRRPGTRASSVRQRQQNAACNQGRGRDQAPAQVLYHRFPWA